MNDLDRWNAARDFLKSRDIPADSEQAVNQANFWADEEEIPAEDRPWNYYGG